MSQLDIGSPHNSWNMNKNYFFCNKKQQSTKYYKDNKKKEGKKEQTMMIAKMAKNDARYAQTLSVFVIEYLLDGFISKTVARNEIELIPNENLNVPSTEKCKLCAEENVKETCCDASVADIVTLPIVAFTGVTSCSCPSK